MFHEKRLIGLFYFTCFYDIIQDVKMYRLCFYVAAFGALVVSACDLQPKIASIPDSIGMFIEDRYPALLADPEAQPEIYNSAVTDYGVYASPELYGSENINDYVLYASVDDYVLAPEPSVESEPITTPEPIQKSEPEIEQEVEDEIMTDYIIVPTYGGNTVVDETPVVQKDDKSDEKPIKKDTETPIVKENTDEIIVVRGDTVYSLSKKHNMSVKEFAQINNLSEPYTLKIGQKLTTRASTVSPDQKKVETSVAKSTPESKVEQKKEIPNVISAEKVQQIKTERVAAATKPVKKTTEVKRVNLTEITVKQGDTLYSISRKYEIPVNDLAVMNKLSAPFALVPGQKLKVPNLNTVQTKTASEIKHETKKSAVNSTAKTSTKVVDKKSDAKNVKTQTPQKSTSVKESEKSKISQNKISSDPKKTLPKISARSSSKFSWPIRGTILSGYGPKKGGLVNDGINISANLGASVKAAENGVVAYAGNEIKGMGNLIIIQHSDGWMTVYAHLNSMNVRRGAKVVVGQPIGTVGKTGKVDKPQLHFEIRKGTKSYNPTQYLKK